MSAQATAARPGSSTDFPDAVEQFAHLRHVVVEGDDLERRHPELAALELK
ncbi:hypothetical protein [Amycolatopsis sp.]|jgi:hypothetical protein|nr:hypothetical protein [Amycolatopsis sp.]